MKQKEKLWNSNYCKVMAGNFMLFFAFYILTPLLPLYLSEHFGATKDMIGLVLSGYTVTALIFRPLSGFMVDSFPRKTVLMICYGVFADKPVECRIVVPEHAFHTLHIVASIPATPIEVAIEPYGISIVEVKVEENK